MGSSSNLDRGAPIFIPGSWADAADSIAYDSVTSPPPVAFICGAKNSGKTTFSRHLLNTFLLRYESVAYLDTDVGQPEFTPPGCLSLIIVDKITPDLAVPCLKTPESNQVLAWDVLVIVVSFPLDVSSSRCYFFGDISSKRDPATYLKYIRALYDYYNAHCTLSNNDGPGRDELPLIVNTPGWVKGIGYEIVVDMLQHICPTHVVKINISAVSKNLPAGAFWLDEDDYASVLVQKEVCLIRDFRLMAYFRQCFPSDVPSTEVFYSLNATIVGLAVNWGISESIPVCVGLGIVRGIDTFKNLLYVITPVPQSTLASVNLLLQGFIQLPCGLLQVSYAFILFSIYSPSKRTIVHGTFDLGDLCYDTVLLRARLEVNVAIIRRDLITKIMGHLNEVDYYLTTYFLSSSVQGCISPYMTANAMPMN
ncbi:Polynucleotide 5'-hydroxyl-kinase NOL9-like protein [Drosera capensis]